MRPVSTGKRCYQGEKLGSVWRAQGAIASISRPLAWPVKSFRALPSYLSLLPLPLLPPCVSSGQSLQVSAPPTLPRFCP